MLDRSIDYAAFRSAMSGLVHVTRVKEEEIE